MRSVFRAFVLCLLIGNAVPACAGDILGWPPKGSSTLPINGMGDWTGLYIGLNGGFGFANAKASGTIGGLNLSASQDLSGALGGGQVGFNWQAGSVVLGLESDIQASGVSNSTVLCPASFCGSAVSIDDKVPWFATFRGRAGLAFERFLVYATGGLAYANLNSKVTMPVGGATAELANWSSTRAAWTVGGGVEFQISSNWFTRLEYLYLDTGSFQATVAIPGVGTLNPTLHVTEQIVRAGVTYRF